MSLIREPEDAYDVVAVPLPQRLNEMSAFDYWLTMITLTICAPPIAVALLLVLV